MPQVLIGIGQFVVAAVGVVGVYGPTSLAVIGAATVVAGAVLANKLISELYGVPSLDTERSRQATVKGTVEPQKLIYGEALVSGPINFVGVAGVDNQDLWHSVVMAGHPVESITDIHFDDEVIPSAAINGSGAVTQGVFGPVGGNTICSVYRQDGTQLIAEPSLDAAFFTINTNEHIGTDLAYVVTQWTLTEDSQEVWDKFLPRDIKALVKGKKVYDPRQDDTSSVYDATVGVSTQRAGTPSTWLWSENPVVCLIDYLTDTYFGLSIPLDRIDLDVAATAADNCDELVDIPNSQQEKRYTCNGVLMGTDTHKNNINKILSSMNGMLTYTSGKFVIRAGAYEAPESTNNLTENMLTGPASLKTSFERNERFNTVRGTFFDPVNRHKKMEFPEVSIASAVTRDNGEVLLRELNLTMTNSSTMAQRIAHKLIQQSDLQKILTFPINLAGVNLAVGDRVNIRLPEFGYADKVFVVLGWSFAESGAGGVRLTLREDSSSAYADLAPASYSTVSSTGVLTAGFSGVLDPQSLTATAGVKSIELNWINPANMTQILFVEIFASPDSSWANRVKIGETLGTQFIHDSSTTADPIVEGNQRYYWVRSRRYPSGEGTDAVSDRNPNSDTSTVFETVVSGLEWNDVSGTTDAPEDNATQNVIYQQNDAPASGTAGDIWIDTNDNYKLYSWDGSVWVEVVQDASAALLAASTAQSTADGAIVAFYQDNAPTNAESDDGDLWFDTNDGNKIYRYDEATTTWEVAQDTAIAQAISDASDAQDTADGKVTTFFAASTAPPTAEGEGDLWYVTDEALLKRWSGTAWVEVSSYNTGDLADQDTVDGGTQIDDDTITTAKINTALESDTFVSGSAGWRIARNGDVQFNNGDFTGDLTADTLTLDSGITIGSTNLDSTVVSGAADGATAIQPGDTLSSGAIGPVTITATELYQGTGTFDNANTGFYFNNQGKFSLRDRLSFDPTFTTPKLIVKGDIEGQVITVGTGDTKATMSSSGSTRFWAGTDDVVSTTPFSVDENGKVIARDISLVDSNGNEYFNAVEGFTAAALTQFALNTEGVKVTTFSESQTDTSETQLTFEQTSDVDFEIKFSVNFIGNGGDTTSAPALQAAKDDIPNLFTLEIFRDTTSNFTPTTGNRIATATFVRTESSTPTASQYRMESSVFDDGDFFFGSASIVPNTGCANENNFCFLTFNESALAANTYYLKTKVSTTDTTYSTTNKVTSTANRTINVTDNTVGGGFSVSSTGGSQSVGQGDITSVSVAVQDGVTVGGSTVTQTVLSGSASFTIGFDDSQVDYNNIQNTPTIPTDTNTTYDYLVPANTTALRLAGSDLTTDTITLSASGATTLSRISGTEIQISSTDTNTVYTLPKATATIRGGIELYDNTVNPTASNGVTSTANRTYGIQLNSSNQAVVNVPWSDNNTVYTLPEATATVRGGIELFSNTDNPTAANGVTSTAGRTYGIQLNSSGQAVVNVPWVNTNTNTTYSAGSLLDLAGTTFNVDLSELTDMTQAWVNTTDEFVVLDSGVQKRKLSSEIFGSNAFNSTAYAPLNNPSFTGSVTIGTNADTTAIVFPDKTVLDNPTSPNDKRQLIKMGQSGAGGMWQASGRGAMLLSSADDSMIIANGDVGRLYDPDAGDWNPNPDIETIYMLSDGQIVFETNLQNQGTNLDQTFTFDTGGSLTIPATYFNTSGNSNQWQTAYNDKINSVAFNTGTGALTFTQQDGTTLTVNLDGRYVESLDGNTTYDLSVPASTTKIRLAGSDATNDDVTITGGTNVTVTRVSATELSISSTDTNTVYTLPEATATTRGGIELFSNTDQSVAANGVTTTAGRTYGIQLNSAGQAVVNVPWSDTNTNSNTTYDYLVPANTTALRLAGSDLSTDTITLSAAGATSLTRISGNEIRISSTDTNTNTTYDLTVPIATTDIRLNGSDSTGDPITIAGGLNTTVTRTSANQLSIASLDTIYTHPTYTPFAINTSGAQVIDVLSTNSIGSVTNATKRTMTLADLGYTGSPTANNYVLPQATSTVRGGIELFSNTDNPTAANSVTSTAGRTYGIQLNSANQAVVNVPWVDTNTNTTYTAGDGLTLSGTEFNLTGSELAGSQDLNNYRTTGWYSQNSNADAISGSNYPVDLAGTLEVINDDKGNGLHTVQRYSQYASTNVWHRTFYNGTWQSWRNLSQDTNTVYTHPAFNGDDFSIDTGPLSGATVISDLDINVTTNSQGHVTDANGTVSTRNMTLADLGYTGATNANNYSLPLATATVRGGIELFSNTDNPTAANAVTSTAGRTYGVQLNSANQAVVNVPWVDTNTNTNTTYDLTVPVSTTDIRLNGSDSSGDPITIAGGLNTTVTRTSASQLSIASLDTIYTHPTYTAFSINTSGAQVIDVLSTNTIGSVTNATKRTMTLADLGYTGSPTANNYSHPTYTARSINTSGATILDILTTDTLGHVTAASTRTLTLANLGYTGATNANNYSLPLATATVRGGIELFSNTDNPTAANAVTSTAGRTYGVQLNSANQAVVNVPWSDTNTVYSHPAFNGDDFSIDTGPLTGATVISDLDINVTTNSQGHVTDANGTVATRTLTLANLGYTGATNANNYVHPAYTARTVSVDTGPLTGATVISDLDFNISSNTIGSVTSAAGTVATRTLTLADLGYTGATNANFITNNNQLTNGAGYYNSGDNVSLGTVNCSSVTATGDITAFSDARLKSNIETLPSDVIYKMRGVTYEKDGHQSSGVIAQELLAAGADELVHDNDVALSVNYNGLTGYLIETVKSLKEELDELKAEIEVLKRG